MGLSVFVFTSLFHFFQLCIAGVPSIGSISIGYHGSQMNWIDRNGVFLLSNNSKFGFGFQASKNDATKFLLNVVHINTTGAIWSANRGTSVSDSDQFIFNEDGNLLLMKGSTTIWTANTAGKGVVTLELRNTGNLVAMGKNSAIIWQSFDHPTNTLVSNQIFKSGMTLVSDPSPGNLTYTLEIKNGDMVLSAGFTSPQPYWSMQQDRRKTINKEGGQATMSKINDNSWRFYDGNNILLWQFVFSSNTNTATWVAVLTGDGLISFYNLDNGGEGSGPSSTQIPSDFCSRPQPCGRYYTCKDNNRCECPSALSTSPKCEPFSSGGNYCGSSELSSLGEDLDYFAIPFVSPNMVTDLGRCKATCKNNCSCVAMFFQNSTGNCFLFNDLGGFRSSRNSGLEVFIKVSSQEEVSVRQKKGSFTVAVITIVVSTILVIGFLLLAVVWYYRKKNREIENTYSSSEEDGFLNALSGTPIRFTYQELETATKGFTEKLGQGGFGSVYMGNLADGTRLAVKKLEGIGQGRKEFRAEVTIIGSIHHHHLVKLKGFCSEGTHRLLVYEFMANGSLDKWIFHKNNEDFVLSWDVRYKIALGTAKGLAYLHEGCDNKIIHCDIKPENVLLDDNFVAKVSDFGLAKLMTREQSHVFTTMRGTRGYLAPEWITNYAISEKSDVYSYGMLLLEMIGGRKNFDASLASEKSHFPSYAFKMMEEGNFGELVDAGVDLDGEDERVANAVKVALWCIQEDTTLRPAMSKVVQMLEGLCLVPLPPVSSPLGTRVYHSFFKSLSSEGTGTSSGPSVCEFNSDACVSAVRLSGPR